MALCKFRNCGAPARAVAKRADSGKLIYFYERQRRRRRAPACDVGSAFSLPLCNLFAYVHIRPTLSGCLRDIIKQ